MNKDLRKPTPPFRPYILFARMLGRDQRLLDRCPDDEKASISLEALAVCYAALYVSLGSATALWTVTTPLTAVIGGCIVGIGVGLFDAANSARTHHSLVDRLASTQSLPRFVHGFGLLGLIPRLVLAVGAAFFVSTFLLQIPFGPDVEAFQSKQEHEINKLLYNKYENILLLEKQDHINQVRDYKANKNEQNKRLNNFYQKKDVLAKQIEYWQNIASCESTGRKSNDECPGVTGIEGEDNAFRYANEKQIRLNESLVKIDLEIDRITAFLNEQETPILSLAQLASIQAAKLGTLVKEDKNYVPVPRTLLYSIENLWNLAHDKPVILALVLAVEAVLVSLDLLGLMITAWRKPRWLEHQKAYQLMKMQSKLERARAKIWLEELQLADKVDLVEERLEMRKHVRAKIFATKIQSAHGVNDGSLH